jgi:predicted RNA methylase
MFGLRAVRSTFETKASSQTIADASCGVGGLATASNVCRAGEIVEREIQARAGANQ